MERQKVPLVKSENSSRITEMFLLESRNIPLGKSESQKVPHRKLQNFSRKLLPECLLKRSYWKVENFLPKSRKFSRKIEKFLPVSRHVPLRKSRSCDGKFRLESRKVHLANFGGGRTALTNEQSR